MPSIQLQIDKDGNVVVRPQGYAGVECKDATRWAERLGKVSSDIETAEMYTLKEANKHLTQEGGC